MVSESWAHIERIRKDFQASQRVKDSLNNSIQALATDLYTKETHFIFELIQNAEDNTYKETEPFISFRLVKADPTKTQNAVSALIIQNNEIGFTSDDVDAICAVGKTTKSKIQGYIGEKGIGFKSVFRITTMPHIFSGAYQFCLPKKDKESGLGYIVPRWIERPPKGIDPCHTTIILPLDKSDFGYERIEEMLRDIESETILFLSKLKKIQIRTDAGDELTISKDDSKMPLVQISIKEERQGELLPNKYKFLLYAEPFDKPEYANHEKRIGINKRDVSIAFPIDENKESAGKIFAYLPVRSDTGLPFLINADFILPSSREEIRNVSWNKWLMKCVAHLVADALPRLKEKYLLTVDLLETLAKRMNELNKNSMFYPIVEAVRDALMHQELLPADEGTFVSARNAKLARRAELRKLLTHDQLRELFRSKDDIRWLSGAITQDRTPDLHSYLMNELDVKEIRPEKFAQLITEDFLQAQTDDWIIQFYNFLGKDNSELWKKPGSVVRQKKILRLEDKSHVIPFQSDGRPNAYLPSSSKTAFPTIRKEIFDDKGAEEFLRHLGLFEPGLFAEVITSVLPKYAEKSIFIDFQDNIEDLRKISKLVKTPLQSDPKNFIGKLRILLAQLRLQDCEDKFLTFKAQELIQTLLKAVFPSIRFLSAVNGDIKNYKSAKEIYFNTTELHMYFENNQSTWFIDKSYPPDLEQLFKELSIGDIPKVKRKNKDNRGYVIIQNFRGARKRGLNGFDPDIEVDGLEYAIKHPSIKKSLFIWNRIAIPNIDCIRGVVESSSRQTFENSKKNEQISQKFGQLLIQNDWLPDKQGKLHKPSGLELDGLPDSFIRDEKLAKLLRMQTDEIREIEEKTGGKFVPIEEYKEFQQWKKSQSGSNENSDKNKIEEQGEKDSINIKDEFIKSFNRLGKTELQGQITDEGKVTNPKRRREKSYGDHHERLQNEPSADERRKKTIRTIFEGPDEQVREYLSQMYGGRCQICGKTFPERAGNPFFVANYIVHRKVARYADTSANALCLCADHFAKWQHGAVGAENILKQIDIFKTESEGGDGKPILNIKLCGEECNIYFKEKHLLDLQELLRSSKSDNHGQE